MMEKIIIIFNGTAGNSNNEEIANRAKNYLEKHGKIATLSKTNSEQDAINQAAQAVDIYDYLVTIGGDGSINTVCAGFLKANKTIPLGIIPGGTVNNFARALKIPLNTDKAIENLLTGTPKNVDLGHIDRQPIISSLTLGRLADISRNVKQTEKKKFGRIVYLFKGIKELFTNRSYKLKITANGKAETLRAQILLITTTNSVGGYVEFNPQAAYDDDYLHVFLLKKFTLPKILTYGSFFLSGNLKQARGVKYFKTKEVKIENLSSRDIKTRIDGDPAMALPITVQTIPDFLKVVMPDK
ncbi:MAG: diacylglycerol kinase family protein [Lentilactobacillus diolivorans]|uniref:diacylglycerol/lipid kinase family protein n=1 Tax=Lentilactobacillus diolivorans TaxID=179838 RepID=UPI0039E8E65C